MPKANSNDKKKYPLHEAARTGKIKIIKKLLNEGVPINDKDDSGNTPLLSALQTLSDVDLCYKVCKLLIDNGADVNFNSGPKGTPLYNVLEEQKDDGRIMKLLIDNGAELEVNVQGKTVLLHAIDLNNVQAVEIFLKAGANPNVYNEEKEFTALTLACMEDDEKENEQLIKLLLSYGANINDECALFYTLKLCKKNSLRLLFENGLNLDEVKTPFPCKGEVAKSNNTNCSCCIRVFSTKEVLKDRVYGGPVVDVLLQNGIYLHPAFFRRTFNLYRGNANSRVPEIETLSVIIKHVALIKIKREDTLDKSILVSINSNNTLQQLYEKYSSQVQLMRQTKVHKDARTSYLDLLTNQGKWLSRSCDDRVIKAMSTNLPEKLFPDYAENIRNNFEKGVLERRAIAQLEELLYDVLVPRTHPQVVTCICNFIGLRHLTAFRFRNNWIKGEKIYI